MKNVLKQIIIIFKGFKLNSFIRKINNVLNSKFFCYTHFEILIADFMKSLYLRLKGTRKYSGANFSSNHGLKHLQAAMDWLCYAQDANHDGGVALSYDFRKGWKASYPETTGYIIPTFFDYYHFSGCKEYLERAISMSDWLPSIQLPNGAFQGFSIDDPPEPRVFNTGQIILGLVKAYKEVGNESYINSAKKAGDWLVEIQDSDGAWRKFAYNGIPHSYTTRVAWPLLELHQITKGQSYKQSAIKHLQWALNNQQENGWFKCNSFVAGSDPYTHTVIYAARGMLESGILLNQAEYIESADRVAKVLFEKFEINNYLHGDFNESWESQSNYSCLTGDAQLSILLMRLYALRNDRRYLNTSIKINQYLKSTQNLNSRNLGIRGAVKGSDPIWGKYISYSYPNWAAKFFTDALMLEEKLLKRL